MFECSLLYQLFKCLVRSISVPLILVTTEYCFTTIKLHSNHPLFNGEFPTSLTNYFIKNNQDHILYPDMLPTYMCETQPLK